MTEKIAIQGTIPAMQPKMKCFQSGFSRPSLAASMLQPNRFIAAFTPAIAISAVNSWMKLMYAMATIMTDDENAYSIQRRGFMPRASHAS